ncbi:DUF4158 domain-containing protein [Deinococcus aestuarii]|uniref:DUF4158 domain-containing protein n=1 Tax=Deinococcus aestuarii TaxID=2774531 RepID=UPI001C0B91AE
MAAHSTPLTRAQREPFTRVPSLDERILSRSSLLREDDLRLVRERRRDFDKLGYAVWLTVLRHLGRALRPGETPPEVVPASLAAQLRADPGRDAGVTPAGPLLANSREGAASAC